MVEWVAYLSSDYGNSWKKCSLLDNNFCCATSDETGQYLSVITNDGINCGIYSSGDYGITWVKEKTEKKIWNSIVSSADGKKLVATSCEKNGGMIWAKESGIWKNNNLSEDILWSSIVANDDCSVIASIGYDKHSMTSSIYFWK